MQSPLAANWKVCWSMDGRFSWKQDCRKSSSDRDMNPATGHKSCSPPWASPCRDPWSSRPRTPFRKLWKYFQRRRDWNREMAMIAKTKSTRTGSLNYCNICETTERSWVWSPAPDTRKLIFHIFVVKLMFEKNESNTKMPGMPQF